MFLIIPSFRTTHDKSQKVDDNIIIDLFMERNFEKSFYILTDIKILFKLTQDKDFANSRRVIN